MKKIGLIFAMLVALGVYAQQPSDVRQRTQPGKVPADVQKRHIVMYPQVRVVGWYGVPQWYWGMDWRYSWYYDWYDPWYWRTPPPGYYYTWQYPEYYEVEFVDSLGNDAVAIYSRYGNWLETRTRLSELPETVRQSLENSKYAGWKRSKHVEKIERPGMPYPVYRVKLSSGLRQVILRFNPSGEIIQQKTNTHVPKKSELDDQPKENDDIYYKESDD